MESMSMQGPITSLVQWLDEASTGSSLDMGGYYGTITGQVPFLKLLQGACMGVAAEQEEQKPLQQQQQHLFGSPAASGGGGGSHLEVLLRFQGAQATDQQLESCVTQSSDAGAGVTAAAAAPRAERKRKRPRPRSAASENKRKKPEEAESQRMTHIAVERNRRRLMNDHLAALRSLIPASYIPRGDQATVVGGAIDYVKQLEQQLLALQAAAAARGGAGRAAAAGAEPVFVVPQYTSYSEAGEGGVDVEATAAVGGHVRVRVAGRRSPGRLVHAVAALEELRLAVLHLAVTSVGHDSVVYCFNLKIEEGCEVATADEVATVVHQIFAYAAACC